MIDDSFFFGNRIEAYFSVLIFILWFFLVGLLTRTIF